MSEELENLKELLTSVYLVVIGTSVDLKQEKSASTGELALFDHTAEQLDAILTYIEAFESDDGTAQEGAE